MAIRGCLLTSSSGLSGQDLTSRTILNWDTAQYDFGGFYSAGSPSKIKIPSSMNGLRGILTGMVEARNVVASDDRGLQARILRNGSFDYTGAGGTSKNSRNFTATGGNGQSVNNHWLNWTTGPVLLNTNDEYEMDVRITGDTSVDIATTSSFGLYVHGQAHASIMCIGILNANQTGKDFTTPVAIDFDGTDLIDTHSIHDASGAPKDFVVPAAADGKYGVFTVQIYNVNAGNGTGSIAWQRIRSGTPSLSYVGFGGNSGAMPNFDAQVQSAQTQVHQLTAGDIYRALIYLSGDNSSDLNKLSGSTPFTRASFVVYG